MNLYLAPVQGHTDAPYRYFHARHYGNAAICFTPFIRWEKNGVRPQDIKALKGDFSDGIDLVPQIIFRDADELTSLVDTLRSEGVSRIDLNMGCPFPLQTARGRGAATILNASLAESVAECVKTNHDISFSVKMRLGYENPDEWRSLLPTLNGLNLHHITLHPRVARQQYGGEVDREQFAAFLAESTNPVVYNGDLRTPDDVKEVAGAFPEIQGIMLGRGALARPSLFQEIIEGQEWTREKRLRRLLDFHRELLDYYTETLCGDHQILSKIKPFWEYSEAEIGRKAWKAIKKSVNMAKYHSAIAMIMS